MIFANFNFSLQWTATGRHGVSGVAAEQGSVGGTRKFEPDHAQIPIPPVAGKNVLEIPLKKEAAQVWLMKILVGITNSLSFAELI